MLTMHCLGSLKIYLDQAPLTGFSTQKERALLVYLACHAGQEFSREALQALLWSESDPEHAARSLRQALVNLRRLLPAGQLETGRLFIRFNSDNGFWLDVAHFERDPVDISLYGGHFLQGFDLRNAPEWEEWLTIRREYWLTRALLALEAQGGQHIRRGEYLQAVQTYQHALTLDPWRESAYQALMCVYVLSGDLAAAREQYDKCCGMLKKGLNVEPSPETVAIYRRVLAGAASGLEESLLNAIPASSSIVDVPGYHNLPFTGREEAHAGLISAWGEARRGQAGLTLVEGEAGLGKTRLVQEVLRQVELRGALVARGRCVEFAGETPYRPWVEALRSILALIPLHSLSPAWLSEVATLLSELRDHLSARQLQIDTGSETARQRLFTAVGRLLRVAARDVVVFLDDLHWADTATLDLLNHLIHDFADCDESKAGRRGSIWVVATYRPEETPLDHPLTRLRMGLGRDGLARRIVLAPLDAGHVASIAAWLSDTPHLAEFLYNESGGSPFVLSEIIRTLQETGRLLPSAQGRWTLSGNLEAGMLPERVEDLTLQRVARLPEALRRWLDFAAVIGERFSLDFLAGVVGETVEQLAPCLQAWKERRLLVEDDTGLLGFTHDKIQEAILQALSPPMRKLIHERIGQTLLDRQPDFGDLAVLAQIAYHFEHSLAPRRAVSYLVRAVEAARQMYANRQALDYALRLFALSDATLRVETLISIAALRQSLLDPSGALQAYQQAAEEAEQIDRRDLLARAWCGLANQIAADGNPIDALQRLAQAEQAARMAQAPLALIEVLYNKGWSLHRTGQNRLAMEAANEALALCDRSAGENLGLLSLCLRLLCSIHIQTGQYPIATQYAERLLRLDRSNARREGTAKSLNTLGEIARLRGDFHTAHRYYQESLEIMQAIGNFSGQIGRRSNLIGALVGEGRYLEAEAAALALLALPQIAAWPIMAETYRFLAEASLGLGKANEAQAQAQKALEIARQMAQNDIQAAAWRVLGQTRPQADECFIESLRLCDTAGLEGERAWTLRAWGLALQSRGEAQRGAQVLAEARALFAQLDMLWPD